MKATQGTGKNGLPLCHNATPMTDYTANMGYDDEGRLIRRPILWDFSRGCKSWASDPSTDPVPLAESWECKSCRHFPADLVALALSHRARRAGKAAPDDKL